MKTASLKCFETTKPLHSNTFLSHLKKSMRQGEDAFLVAVRRVAEARGGMLSLSQNTGLNRANLYRSIAVGGDPKLSTLLKVLQALGVGMSKVVSHRTEQDVRA